MRQVPLVEGREQSESIKQTHQGCEDNKKQKNGTASGPFLFYGTYDGFGFSLPGPFSRRSNTQLPIQPPLSSIHSHVRASCGLPLSIDKLSAFLFPTAQHLRAI
jgi:hypothetical protein